MPEPDPRGEPAAHVPADARSGQPGHLAPDAVPGGALAALTARARDEPNLAQVLGAADAVLSVPGRAQAFALAGLARLSGRRPLLVVTARAAEAARLADDLSCFLGARGALEQPGHPEPPGDPEARRGAVVGEVAGPVATFPAWQTLPFERVSPDVETMGRRLAVLWRLFGDPEPPVGAVAPLEVVVAPVRALLQRLAPWREAARPVVVVPGAQLDAGELVERLVAMGYRREHQVEHRGELAVRGGIVDVFPSTAAVPVRIDLFGDEVDRLTSFEVADQRSDATLEAAVLYGCREVVPDEAMRARAAELAGTEPWGRAQWDRLAEGMSFDGMESWLPWLYPQEEVVGDLLGPQAQVVLLDPPALARRAAELHDEEASLAASLARTWGIAPAGPASGEAPRGEPGEVGEVGEPGEDMARLTLGFERLLGGCPAPVLAMSSVPAGPDEPAMVVRGIEPVAGDGAKLARQVTALASEGYGVTLCAATPAGARRLGAVLADEGVVAPVREAAPGGPGITVVVAPLSQGFVLPALRLAVLAEPDVTGRRATHRVARPRARPVDGFFDDMAVGSYVVHRQHGVARFAGVTTRSIGGTTRDYLVLEYRGSDRLYLPVDQIAAVTPYSGGEAPTLSKMGGADWQRTRARARAAAGEVAEELVKLYRARLAVPGHGFAPDTPWQHEVESAFPFTETADQLRAIEEVKADMESPRPMDRLVCGDVGFGKTEVAVRAVFKAVQDGAQAAVLVPTTLLASQHFQTFSERYAGYPVRVELLSRFLTGPQVRAVIQGLADGTVDVVVGTHRLLGGDVSFKNLGLLVVDEEQRFGVSHKEAIKALTEGVDVLTLTASPIPRTLEMALTGIRDLSMVNTPPADRRPILTYVGEYDEGAVTEALRRELLREGQAFFVHNRVADIDAVATRLGALVPEARIAVAHGQMDEGSLEKVVLEFWERKYDVLVCTTIIESGIDMPSVNTLIVDRADLLGLGQLHQIRGRVGRSGARAYAYLFHPADRTLSEQAYERLRTIGEQTELGSGFKIAMRDLEIRGAGNLLGSDQSGHIAAVGYDLYVQLVAEAVAEARGEPRAEVPAVSLDVPGDAHLPTAYVAAEDARLEAYRRLAATRSVAEVDDVAAEWTDRFGPLPGPAQGLLDLARLRSRCLEHGVEEVAVAERRMGGTRQRHARLSPVHLAASAEVRLRRLAPGASYDGGTGMLRVPLQEGVPAAPVLSEILDGLFPAAPPPAAGPSET